jgi:hypothetical protein
MYTIAECLNEQWQMDTCKQLNSRSAHLVHVAHADPAGGDPLECHMNKPNGTQHNRSDEKERVQLLRLGLPQEVALVQVVMQPAGLVGLQVHVHQHWVAIRIPCVQIRCKYW